MPQDPNAWWSKEIGKDLTKGMLEPWQGIRHLGPREVFLRILTRVIPIAVLEGLFAYFIYCLVKVLERHSHG
jgi:hypothetical protein